MTEHHHIDYPHSEDDIRLRLGCSRGALRELRKSAEFPQGAFWEVVGKEVRWSVLGAAKALELLGGVQIPAAKENAPSGQPALPGEPVVERVTLLRGGFPNPRVVLARRENGAEVYVRVPDSRNFVPRMRDGSPMTFQAREERGQWVLVGRSPRWPGRW